MTDLNGDDTPDDTFTDTDPTPPSLFTGVGHLAAKESHRVSTHQGGGNPVNDDDYNPGTEVSGSDYFDSPWPS